VRSSMLDPELFLSVPSPPIDTDMPSAYAPFA
jgi:hypothetical protein